MFIHKCCLYYSAIIASFSGFCYSQCIFHAMKLCSNLFFCVKEFDNTSVSFNVCLFYNFLFGLYRYRDRNRDRGRSGEGRRGGFGGGSFGGGRGFGGGGSGGGNSLKGKQPGERLRKPRWDMSSLQPFRKDFYVPHPNVMNR